MITQFRAYANTFCMEPCHTYRTLHWIPSSLSLTPIPHFIVHLYFPTALLLKATVGSVITVQRSDRQICLTQYD